MKPLIRFAAFAALAALVAGCSSPAQSPSLPHAQQVLFTGCSYSNTVPAPDNGYNGGPGQFTVTATNQTSSTVTVHSLNVQFSSFQTSKVVVAETVHPSVTLAAGASRQLSFSAPQALQKMQENDPQAYGDANGSDIDCSQNGWS